MRLHMRPGTVSTRHDLRGAGTGRDLKRSDADSSRLAYSQIGLERQKGPIC